MRCAYLTLGSGQHRQLHFFRRHLIFHYANNFGAAAKKQRQYQRMCSDTLPYSFILLLRLSLSLSSLHYNIESSAVVPFPERNKNNNFLRVRQTTQCLLRSAVFLNMQVLRSAVVVICIIILSLQELQITIYTYSHNKFRILAIILQRSELPNHPENALDHYFKYKSLVKKQYFFLVS